MAGISQIWEGISPILFIMIATLAAGGYEVFKQKN
jgi:hypothetical protein|tara:strand:- start:12563 stop:12667 length:105 start_codon:yes stop_codon:yes gene_type:complete